MVNKEPITRMIFRVYPAGDVIAFMPDLKNGEFIMSYQNLGQHGDATPKLIDKLAKATNSQMKELKEELEGLGYRIKVIN